MEKREWRKAAAKVSPAPVVSIAVTSNAFALHLHDSNQIGSFMHKKKRYEKRGRQKGMWKRQFKRRKASCRFDGPLPAMTPSFPIVITIVVFGNR